MTEGSRCVGGGEQTIHFMAELPEDIKAVLGAYA